MVEAYLDFLIGQALPEETYLLFLFFCLSAHPAEGRKMPSCLPSSVWFVVELNQPARRL